MSRLHDQPFLCVLGDSWIVLAEFGVFNYAPGHSKLYNQLFLRSGIQADTLAVCIFDTGPVIRNPLDHHPREGGLGYLFVIHCMFLLGRFYPVWIDYIFL